MTSPIDEAKEQALGYLTYRPRSGQEVRRYLKEKGHSPATQSQVVQWLEHLGYVDDRQFAQQWIENRCRQNPMGARRLSQELWQKGIARPVIEEALADFQAAFDEKAMAMALAQKQASRYRGEQPGVIARRLTGFLERRGFGHEHVQQAVQQALEALQLS